MSRLEFDKRHIDQLTIGIGVDVRPPIELALDALRIQEFYNQVSEQFPQLFADLSQSKTNFQISKEIPLPGKGSISVPTFTLTPRGPVFNFPITLPSLLDDHEWSNTLNEDVIECLEIFHRHLPGTRFFRIGKVRNLVFHWADADDPGEAFRERFCPRAPANAGELTVAWNDPDERYNRKLTAKVMQKGQIVRRNVGDMVQPVLEPGGEIGINIIFDVNNRNLHEPLDSEQMTIILNRADELYSSYLYDLLEGEHR